MNIVLMLLGVPVLLAFAYALRGYVLATLWVWFVVPVFALPVLSVPYAIGLSLIVGMMTNHRGGNETTDPDMKWVPLVLAFLGPLLILGVAWLVKQFI